MGRSFFPTGTGGRIFYFIILGISFTLLGIIIASNLDFTPKSSAQISPGPYPVTVDAEGKQRSPFVDVVERVHTRSQSRPPRTSRPHSHSNEQISAIPNGFQQKVFAIRLCVAFGER